MGSLFYILGKKVGPKVRQAKWIWQSMAGGETNAIKMEYQVGRDLAREIRNRLEPDNEPKTIQMLDETGSRLIKCVANRLRTFSFEAVKGPEPNAFALPGGFIFVTGSLMELCEWDRDELAFILGHEMAHVIRGHAIRRFISSSAINTLSRTVPIRGQIAGWVRKVGVQFLENAYSQELESQADKLGVLLAGTAGYNQNASVQLLRRLAELNISESQFDLGSYFSSHPPFEVRISNINHFLHR